LVTQRSTISYGGHLKSDLEDFVARRRSFIAQVQREIARQQRAATRTQATYHRQQQAMHREAERAAKAAQRATVAEERERKRLYLEARVAAVAADNADLQAHLDELDGLLATTLSVDDHVELQRLKKVSHHPPFEPGPLATPFPAPHWSQYVPTAPTGLAKLFGGASKYEQQLAVARQSFAQAQAQHAAAEEDRRQRLAATEAAYQRQPRLFSREFVMWTLTQEGCTWSARM
jgi:restriction system protein